MTSRLPQRSAVTSDPPPNANLQCRIIIGKPMNGIVQEAKAQASEASCNKGMSIAQGTQQPHEGHHLTKPNHLAHGPWDLMGIYRSIPQDQNTSITCSGVASSGMTGPRIKEP